MNSKLLKMSHIDANGNAKMVDISKKNDSERIAIATGEVIIPVSIIKKIKSNKISKGNVLTIAKIAGIMAAKRTGDLIPLCHTILTDIIDIQFRFEKNRIVIIAMVKTKAKTGVEMEALTAVSLSALTIYDMCKSLYKGIEITGIKLLKKVGGKSGLYQIDSAGKHF